MKEPTISEWKKLITRWKSKKRTPHAYFDDLISRPNMRRVYPVPASEVEQYVSFSTKSLEATDETITAALEELGVENIDLDSNIGYMVGDSKNPRKLGKILNAAKFTEISDLLLKRNNQANPTGNFNLVISAHPYDICRASYKRNWSSCLNPSSYYHFGDILTGIVEDKKSNMIAYLVKDGDEKIHRPYGRTFIHPYEPNTSTTNNHETFNIYDHISTVKVAESDINKPTLFWNTSNGFYGKFPQYFRYKLAKIVNEEINKDHPLVKDNLSLLISGKFRGAYVDGNDYTICSLRHYKKPAKKTPTKEKSKTIVNNKSNPSVNAVIEYNTSCSRWSGRRHWLQYSQSAKNVYEILNNNITRDSIAKFDESRLSFAQIRNILRKKPSILNKKYMRDYFRNMGDHYVKVVENYYTP